MPLAIAFAQVAQADFNPITLAPDNFNLDMIVEKTGPRPLIQGGTRGAPTTASVDDGIGNGGNTWNEQGYFLSDATVGLPPAGTTISTNNHQFQFAPSYTANNAIMLDGSFFTNANWRLSTPTSYGALSFLTSGGRGGCVFRYTVQRQDGTTASGELASPDWFNVALNIGWIGNGRVHAQNFNLDRYGEPNPRLYVVDASLPASTSVITNIQLQYVSGNANGHSVIMGISGAASMDGAFAPISGSGHNADVVVEATAPRRWDLEIPTPPTTATMDNGLANGNATWFEQGVYAPSNVFGLPPAGSVFAAESAPDHKFKMAPSYEQPNVLLLTPAEYPFYTVTLPAPVAFSGLSILTASGSGSTSVGAVLYHQDGSTQSNLFTSPDWFNNSPVAWTSYGRINVTDGRLTDINTANPRLYFADFPVTNSTSPITSIEFTLVSPNNRAAIFAISGTLGGIAPSINQNPVSVTTNSGVSVAFSVQANGTAPLAYRWQKSANGVFMDLAGGPGGSLVLNNIQQADATSYRVVVENAYGSITSSVAVLTIISPLQDITQPGDAIVAYQPNGGSSPGGEPVANAINNNTTKYLNFGKNGATQPFVGPVGFIVSPATGRTIVTGMRFYAANDATERDPAEYSIEGSNDGGSTWTMLSSGPLSLPTARNAAALDLAPLTQSMQQVLFANSLPFATYRVVFANVRNNAVSLAMQIGEVEILGVVDNSGFPIVTAQPQPLRAFTGQDVTFTVAASGTAPLSYQWRREVDGMTEIIAGATGATLNLNGIKLSDAGDYRVVISNTVGSAQSASAQLAVFSTLQDVTDPGDVIEGFGDLSGTAWADTTNAYNAIDGSVAKWQNGGSGFSASAGFPPFKGPVGLIITPVRGATVVSGLRVYTANDATERDPADYKLEGSADGGATYHLISSGPLSLPAARSSDLVGNDPLQAALQEVLFANNASYSSYRLTFTNARDNSAANSLQIAEVELLGVSSSSVSPFLTVARAASGAVTLSTSMPGILESTTSLDPANTVWTNEGPVSGTVTITPAQGVSAMFYRIRLQ